MNAAVYIVDTSSIIDLFKRYPSNVFQKLWKELGELIKKRRLISHRYVLYELSKKCDDAFEWTRERGEMFKNITKRQTEIMKDIASKFPELIDVDREVDADPWLIALAQERKEQQKLIHGEVEVIVTEERFKPNKVNIPFVCRKLGIEYTNLIGLMMKEGWKF